MFEKESQDYAMKEVASRQELYIKGRADIDADYEKVKKIWQDGAEFGYNKANEWHYVKDGKLDDVIDIWDKKRKYLIMARFTNNLGEYDEVPLLAYFDHLFSHKWCTSKIDYLHKFYITWWKEIVFPKENE